MEFSVEGIAALLGKLCLLYVVSTMTLAAGLAAWQEYKIWRPQGLPTLTAWGCVKVFLFNLLWFTFCLIGSILIVLKWIFTFGKSDIARDGNLLVEDTVSRLCLALFVGRVETRGLENLPSESSYCNTNASGSKKETKTTPAPVFVANHESQLDIAAVYRIQRRFKWIAKQSVLYLPGVGAVMWLSDHVLIQRKGNNHKSVSNLFDKSNDAVQSGIPMFIFPQGTRRIAERRPFKDGAFKIALENQSDLVPISVGIPRNVWNSWYPLSLKRPEPITITVHPPIPVKGTEDRESLKKLCFDKIYSALEPLPDAKKDR